MNAKDLKVGDIYIPIGGRTAFRIRHLVVGLYKNYLTYKTLDKAIDENGILRYYEGMESEDYYEDLDEWKFKIVGLEKKGHLPNWW